MKRLGVCAAALLWFAAAAAQPMPERTALLARAEAELARGETAASLDDFERAAMMLHAPDAEMGLLRAALQDGQYRRALAFCAHTAGAHLEASDASALYAWLLRVGGQAAVADRVLAETRVRATGAAVPNAVADAFARPLPVAKGVLLDLPHRMAPWPVMLGAQAAVPATARLLGGAVLVSDGAAALVPTSTIPAASNARLWVRNGLGQTTEAVIDRSDAALESAGVALLKLTTRLAPGAQPAAPIAARDPFAGSPGYIVQFALSADAAWPWLRQGFFGGSAGAGLRRLGFSDAGGAPGAAVLDRQGRLAGVSLRAANGEALWLPASAWQRLEAGATNRVQAAQSSPADAKAETPGGSPLVGTPDAVYEAGLRLALQVIAAD